MYHFFIHIIGWRLSVSINDMLYVICYIYINNQHSDCDSFCLCGPGTINPAALGYLVFITHLSYLMAADLCTAILTCLNNYADQVISPDVEYFIPRQHALACRARYSYTVSVRPSVHLFVRPWYHIVVLWYSVQS